MSDQCLPSNPTVHRSGVAIVLIFVYMPRVFIWTVNYATSNLFHLDKKYAQERFFSKPVAYSQSICMPDWTDAVIWQITDSLVFHSRAWWSNKLGNFESNLIHSRLPKSDVRNGKFEDLFQIWMFRGTVLSRKIKETKGPLFTIWVSYIDMYIIYLMLLQTRFLSHWWSV